MTLQPQEQDTDNENPNGFNWPSRYLLTQNDGALYFRICMPLYEAASNGNWAEAKTILVNNPELLRCAIVEITYGTVLQVAAGTKHTAFVRELVNSGLLEEQDFIIQDRHGKTAFCAAALSGNLEMLNLLLERTRRLLELHGALNMLRAPLYIAAQYGHREMAWFIYRKVETEVDGIEWGHLCDIFFACLDRPYLFDLALELFQRFPNLAMERKDGKTALHMLASMPSALARDRSLLSRIPKLIKKCWGSKDRNKALELVRSLWREVSSRGFPVAEETIKTGPFSALSEAARFGNWRFISEIVSIYPELLYAVDNNNQTIFHIAVSYRHANIFNHIHKIGLMKFVIMKYETKDGDNMLHLAATLPPR